MWKHVYFSQLPCLHLSLWGKVYGQPLVEQQDSPLRALKSLCFHTEGDIADYLKKNIHQFPGKFQKQLQDFLILPQPLGDTSFPIHHLFMKLVMNKSQPNCNSLWVEFRLPCPWRGRVETRALVFTFIKHFEQKRRAQTHTLSASI